MFYKMGKSATIKREILILLITDFIIETRQSIAGITYHDDFGVDERYRNINECDPFYWHPLHLPEHCAEMFANSISSRAAAAVNGPVRIITRNRKQDFDRLTKSQEDIYSLRHYYKYFEPEYEQQMYETEHTYDNDNDYSNERYEQEQPNSLVPYYSPYDKMLEFLRQDISQNPIAPVIGMSNYGPVAMYQQPVSRRSKDIINQIARAYARANKPSKSDDGYYYGKIEIPSDNKTSNIPPNQDTESSNEMLVENIERTKKENNKPKKKNKKRKHKGLMIQ